MWDVVLLEPVEAWFLKLLLVFDPARQAVVLVAGDKDGRWEQWYRDNVPLAEARYERYCTDKSKERP